MVDVSSPAGPGEVVLREEGRAAMAVALAHLPEEDRTRLAAHEVDDGVDADLRSPLTERLLVRRNVEFPGPAGGPRRVPNRATPSAYPLVVGRRCSGYSMPMNVNAIVVLSEDHSALQALFGRVSQPDENRPAVLDQLLRSLTAHVATEKQLVVPILVGHSGEGEALARQLGDDHDAIEKLVILVERRKVNSPDVPDLVNQLLEITQRHTRQADECLLPFLRDHLSDVRPGRPGRGDALRRTATHLAPAPSPARHRPPRQDHPQGRRTDRSGPRFDHRSPAPWSLTRGPSTVPCAVRNGGSVLRP